MRELLERLSKESLVDFLVEYAKNDATFINAINVRFREPEFNEELRKIEKEIDYALAGASDYRSHNSWGHIDFCVGDVYSEIRERTKQGHIRLAFSETELLYRKLLEIFEYQGECEVSDEAEYCLGIMSDIADSAVLDEDKAYIFNKCIELAEVRDGKDYGADYEDKLLGISAKFVTLERRTKLENAVERYKQSWRGEEIALIQHEIIRKFDGIKAADCFIAENLCFSRIREIALEKAITSENYSEAEKLCVDALSDGKQHYGISPWLYRLYSIHEMTNDTDKMVETAETVFFSGDSKYYGVLKTLRKEQGGWDAYYPELLEKCKMKLSVGQYMQILELEKEYAMLMNQLKEHPEQVHQYGLLLAEMYPSKVWAIFAEQLDKEAEAASSRKMYRTVCVRIKRFMESGFQAEVAGMINDFKIKYKRKPAFIDELGRI